MTIRDRLALRFVLLASLILGVGFLVVYAMSARYRIEEFQHRIHGHGMNTANLLLQVDEVDRNLLGRLDRINPSRVPFETIRIYDEEDGEIYSSGVRNMGEITTLLLEEIRGSTGLTELDKSGESIGFSYQGSDESFVVLVSGEDRFGRSKLRNLGRVMLVTFGFGILITFIVGRVYARQALEPLKRLVGEMRGMEAGDLLKRVDVGNERDEISQLAGSFNELLDRLKSAFDSQRQFIANASHELRTPLTAISGQLEVLLLMDRTTQQYRSAVVSVLEDMRSLNRLADRLLLLAQVDNSTAIAGFVPVRLDEQLWQARSEVLRKDPKCVIDVTLGEVEDEVHLQVSGNEDLLRSLVFNLMENGCKYSDDDRVEVTMRIAGAMLVVDIADHGIGIPENERDLIFGPFVRGSNTIGTSGHGIGLSLAKRIAELHGGRVSYRKDRTGASVFTVELPHL